ncbi:Gtr1/RagA G protein Gtr2 [Artomyces pyxidatus]|uniref:Gtr1/RagA G protein Gtr2 n=1 Tax=Artomyces pyxidatus TaxID=48021 RepID=A0ACB8TFU3_9AGAM|nr:Gtr1/RagA G protein Gtr2 [Artomyces pyxidatus]
MQHSNGTKSPTIDVQRTKILLLGQRRSGKTSIQQVLFNDVSPKQTFYLEPTTRIVKDTYDTVIPLEIWDCPGNVTLDTLGASLSDFSSIIFVIDIQDSYQQPVARMLDFFIAAYQESPDICLEVLVHKAEAFTDDYKIENFRHIQQRVIDELLDISQDYEQMPLNFHLTSVYDHSIHEAFSRVLHKLIDSLPYLEDLLNVFCANSQSSKAFLFDVKSRLYVATDASPVDTGTHNLCCDYVKTLNAFGPLYKSSSSSAARLLRDSRSSSPSSGPSFYPSAAVTLAPSTQGTTLTYHSITPQLALLALMHTAVFEEQRGLLEYNVVFFREGVQEISQVEKDARMGSLVV